MIDRIRGVALAVAVVALPMSPAAAVTRLFSAMDQNVNPPASPVGRCAPAAFTVNIGPGNFSASGTSNFGAFAPTQSHCIVLPLPATYSDGRFDFAFAAGDDLTGTYTGALSDSGMPGVFTNVQNFVVTGGTGRFLGASGSFVGNGTITFAPGQPPRGEIALNGRLALPAVPEPAAWTMMIAGFGLVGQALRRRSGTPALAS